MNDKKTEESPKMLLLILNPKMFRTFIVFLYHCSAVFHQKPLVSVQYSTLHAFKQSPRLQTSPDKSANLG